jgi:two-component system chemotaxis response regulator CheY
LIRHLVKKSLNELGYNNVEIAEDGEQGKELFLKAKDAKDPFEIVISDWKMPKMTGLELLKFVRAEKNLPNVAFIMLTAEGERSSIIDAVGEGVDAYIFKPFQKPDLEKAIQKILKKYS